MQKIIQEQQLKNWNPLKNEMILTETPLGIKSVPLSSLGLDSSIENSLRLHIVHAMKRRW